MNKKNVFLWALYDFANSLGFINVSFYFALWFVSDHKVSDIWISIPVALSTLFLLLTLPSFGTLSDRMQKRMPFLIGFTLLAVAMLFCLGIIALTHTAFTSSTVIVVVILYFLFQYFYQASLAFYNSFLHGLAPEKTKEKISGIGMAAGQLGNIVGLLLVFPIAQKKIVLFGASGRAGTFLIASLLFLIFSLPVLLLLKDKRKSPAIKGIPIGKSFKETLKDLQRIRQYPGVLQYLITYYLFADAILTLQLFASLYLEKVSGLADREKYIAFISGLIFAIIGALLSGKIANLFKGTRRTIATFIAMWALFITIFAFTTSGAIFITMLALNGFAFGVLFSLSRAFYSQIVPPERQGEFFGLYVLFEKIASIFGPLVWSLTIFLFASFGETMSYRFAMLSLALLVVISFFVFRSVKDPISKTSIQAHS